MALEYNKRKYTTTLQDGKLAAVSESYNDTYPVTLRTVSCTVATLTLPFRSLPDPEQSIALLMTLQSPHRVIHRLSEMLTEEVADWQPDTIVGIPTLGFPLAWEVSDRLGHPDFVALTNSVKFWQDNSLITSVESVTSAPKPICLDQYSIDRIIGQRVAIIDDVANTGASLKAAIDLLRRANPSEIKVALVLTEGHQWEEEMDKINFNWRRDLRTLGHIPTFERTAQGSWRPKLSTV